jgi:hypothetical protein
MRPSTYQRQADGRFAAGCRAHPVELRERCHALRQEGLTLRAIEARTGATRGAIAGWYRLGLLPPVPRTYRTSRPKFDDGVPRTARVLSRDFSHEEIRRALGLLLGVRVARSTVGSWLAASRSCEAA